MITRAGRAPSPEGIQPIREPPGSRQHHPRAIEPTRPASVSEARVVPDRPRTTPSPSGGGALFDWIIIGGGPHGVCAARALTAGGASVRIVDPSGALLERWSTRARAVEMVWMRSPAGHHLDAQPVSLHHFLHRPEHADVAELAGRLRRPTHEAFLRHSREVVETAGLDRSVVRGRVDSIRRRGDELLVLGEDVELRGERVLIATGSNTPRIPAWAKRMRDEGAPIRHVFEGDAPLDLDLVGGGISSVQRALMVHRATRRTVRVWMRHPLREAEFDFDRDWT
ncbi:MAG: FAD/NAD(P)-binding protein [Planctomycetota bacterium]|nr:FAD/NAD(P)-binding protein [Planctomycetota bacterium]